MIKITQINKFDDILYLKEDWNRLLEKSETKVIFLTFEWISNWWRTFGSDKKLLVLLIKSEERLIGIAPLVISTSKTFGIQINIIEFIGTPLSDYSDFIISEKKQEVLNEIFSYLLEIPNWDLINLREIPEMSSTLSISKKIMYNFPLSFNMTFSTYCPTIILQDESKSEHIANKKLRKDIMRHINFFEKNGELSFLHFTDTTHIETLLNIFFEQHIERWKVTSTPSKFNKKRFRSFYRELAFSLSKTGWFGFSVLKFNDIPIAFHYGFSYDNRYSYYTPSYDLKYSNRSPGKILLKFLIEFASDNNFKEVDLARGAEKYKFWWSTKTRKNFHIHIFKKKFFSKSRYIYYLYRIYDSLKPYVKKHKFIRRMLTNYKK